MSTESAALNENGLQSQFAILRALPLKPSRAPLPGLTLRAGASRLGLLGIIAALFFLVPLMALISMSQKQRSVPNRPLINARVVQSEIVSGWTDAKPTFQTRFLKYRFQIDGRIYTGSVLAHKNAPSNAARVGDTVPVRYDARDPRQNAPDVPKHLDDFPWPLLLILLLLAVAVFCTLALLALQVWFLARELCVRGNLAQGHIEWIRPRAMPLPNSTSSMCEVLYRYNDAQGETRKGTMSCDNTWLMLQWKIDAPVVVAYDPKKPVRNVILDAFVR